MIFGFESQHFGKQRYKQKALLFRKHVNSLSREATFKLSATSQLLLCKFGWVALMKPFSTSETRLAWGVSPSNFVFGNLRLYRDVKEATVWRLDISKFPLKRRISSARQFQTTL
jgi:hypothetical protein